MGNNQPTANVEQFNRYPRRLIGAALAAVLLSLLLFGLPFAALSDDTLFEPVADAPAFATNSADAARRARVVRINWNALDPRASELQLNLFDNLDLVAELNRVDTSVTGGYVWVGNIRGEAGGMVTLAVHEGVLSGSIHRHGREWSVELDARVTEPEHIELFAEFGIDRVSLGVQDLDPEVHGRLPPVYFAPPEATLSRAMNEVHGRFDVMIANSESNGNGRAGRLEFGFPNFFRHALFESPYLGVRGWAWFIEQIAAIIGASIREPPNLGPSDPPR